jgi:hypothetical protein
MLRIATLSDMAIIIPTAIVAAWLILLFLIAFVVCCRKRYSAHSLIFTVAGEVNVASQPCTVPCDR